MCWTRESGWRRWLIVFMNGFVLVGKSVRRQRHSWRWRWPPARPQACSLRLLPGLWLTVHGPGVEAAGCNAEPDHGQLDPIGGHEQIAALRAVSVIQVLLRLLLLAIRWRGVVSVVCVAALRDRTRRWWLVSWKCQVVGRPIVGRPIVGWPIVAGCCASLWIVTGLLITGQ